MTDQPGQYPAPPPGPEYHPPGPEYQPPGQDPAAGYPPPHVPHPGYAQPVQQPYGYDGSQPAYGQPPASYPGPYAHQQPYGYAPYPASRGTNGMAIASLVLGVVWLGWVGSFLALIFGYVARSQLKRHPQEGGGLAIAGIVLGWIGVLTLILWIIFVATVTHHLDNCHDTYNSYSNSYSYNC
jgi:hypothetical protein